MKKIAAFLSLILVVILFVTAHSSNPYTGKYGSNDNVILKLEKNNKCEIIKDEYKDAFYFDGKYTIKDNKVKITFNKGQNYYGITGIEGKAEGNKITLYDPFVKGDIIYFKE